MNDRLFPAPWPIPLTTPDLAGNLVTLEGMTGAHIEELVCAGADPLIWVFTTSRGDTPERMRHYAQDLLRDWERGSALPFVVRQKATGEVVGCTRLKSLSRQNRSAVAGSWYSPKLWRSGVNLEAKLLLLNYAFNVLQCVRVEFHTDERNVRSRESLEKLGTQLEGVLRSYQVTRGGTLRDSAIYSILSGEWPAIQKGIVARLARHGRGR